MTEPAKFSIEELVEVESQFNAITHKVCGILIFDPSFVKSRATVKAFNDSGYFNVEVVTDLKKIGLQLKEKGKFSYLILDADVPDNETFKTYLSLKQKDPNTPPAVFLRNEVTENAKAIFQKGGALGCLKKPIDVSEFQQLLPNSIVDEDSSSKVVVKELEKYILIRLHGEIDEGLMKEFVNKLMEAQVSDKKECIIDCCKLRKIEDNFENKVKTMGENFNASEKLIDIYDPKNKLKRFNFEQSKGIKLI